LKKEFVTVNGDTASTATFIRGGETICLSIPEGASTLKRLNLPLEVLYEDEYLAAVRKPAGILVSGNRFKTIARALPHNLRPSTLPDATVPQPVHRLDYATTGILLAGKTSLSIRTLNKIFERKKIEKTYYAVAVGEMNQSGKITDSIDGKKAHTEYVVQASVPSERFGQLNLVRLIPGTGRRHQLRKHLSGIGNPVLGDATYGSEPLILKGKGLYLHAFSLKFVHPFTQQKISITDELPEKFRKIFTNHQGQ